MLTLNNSFSVGDKVLKRFLKEHDSRVTQGTDEDEVDRAINNHKDKLNDKHVHYFKTYFLPRQVKWYYQEMQEGDDGQDALSNIYTSAEIKGVERSMIQSGKESCKMRLQ